MGLEDNIATSNKSEDDQMQLRSCKSSWLVAGGHIVAARMMEFTYKLGRQRSLHINCLHITLYVNILGRFT